MTNERPSQSGTSRFTQQILDQESREVSPFAKALLEALEQQEPIRQPEQAKAVPGGDPLLKAQESILSALAGWRADHDVLVTALAGRRQKILEAAWKCGFRNIKKLAEILGVSRDTVYDELKEGGINPSEDRRSPVESQALQSGVFYTGGDLVGRLFDLQPEQLEALLQHGNLTARPIDYVAVHTPCGQRYLSYAGDHTDPARKHDDACPAAPVPDDTDEWAVVTDKNPGDCIFCGEPQEAPATHMAECAAYQGPTRH